MDEYGLNIYTVSIPIITGIIAYWGSRHQCKVDFRKVKKQCETEIKKIEEQCKSDIKKIQEQCELDIKKLEKQSQADIEKIKTEFDKQADIYEKNKKIDMYSSIISKAMDNPDGTIEIISKMNEKAETFNKFNNLVSDFFCGSTKSASLEIACDSGINSVEIRSLQTLIAREVTKQVNIENIIVKARDFIKEKESVSDEPVDQDWATRYFNIAQDVSDEQMQNLWAKILSDEIEKPKSYSVRTLEVVKNLSKEDANLITKICGLGLENNGGVSIIGDTNFMEKQGVKFVDTLLLQELNIAKFENIAVKIKSTSHFKFKNNAIIVKNKNEDKEIKVSVAKLSKVGEEIYNLVDKQINMEYIKDVANFIKLKGDVEVSLVDLFVENGNYVYSEENKINL